MRLTPALNSAKFVSVNQQNPLVYSRLLVDYYIKRQITMKRPINLLLLGLTALYSCASLTKSQVESVNNFATLASQGSAYPEKVLNQIIEVRYDNRILLASQNVGEGNPITFKELENLSGNKKDELAPIKGITKSLGVINAYAQALKRLSSPDFAKTAGTSAETLGKSVDELTAVINQNAGTKIANVGGALTKTLKEVGGRYIRYKQTRAIKEYVNTGDSLVEAAVGLAEAFMKGSPAVFITSAQDEMKANTDDLFKSINKSPYERYQWSLTSFKTVDKLNSLKTLNQQSVDGLRQITLAHKELKKALATKQTLSEVGQELFSLYTAVQDLQDTYQAIKF